MTSQHAPCFGLLLFNSWSHLQIPETIRPAITAMEATAMVMVTPGKETALRLRLGAGEVRFRCGCTFLQAEACDPRTTEQHNTLSE